MPETNVYYKGSIDGRYGFKMVLRNETKPACVGSYFYLTQKKPIVLNGTCGQGKVELTEETKGAGHRKTKANGFSGAQAGNSITGVWKSPSTGKSYPFEATKITPDKKEVLEDARGEYRLTGISGFYGANTMDEIYKQKGQWRADESGIVDAMRQSSPVKLKTSERNLLSSFRLTVDESLAVTVYAGADLIATFPFSEKGIFSLDKSPGPKTRWTGSISTKAPETSSRTTCISRPATASVF